LPSPMWVGIIQATEGLNKIQKWRKDKFFYLSWVIQLFLPFDFGAPGSWDFRLRPGHRPLVFLGFRPLSLDWKYTTSFPGSPPCKQQTVGLLSVHNYISQSLIIHFFLYISLYILLILFLWRPLTCPLILQFIST